MELFQVTNAIFDKRLWKQVPQKYKYKYAFMINRFLSIKYPVEVNNMQIDGLGQKNTARIMDHWNILLSRRYRRTPDWMRIKGGRKKKEVNATKGFKKETILTYLRIYEVDSKMFDIICREYKEDLRKDLRKIEKNE